MASLQAELATVSVLEDALAAARARVRIARGRLEANEIATCSGAPLDRHTLSRNEIN